MFTTLRKYNLKLNLNKCTFGIRSGEHLGFLVSNRGTKVNLIRIKAIEEIPDILNGKKCHDPNFTNYRDDT